MQDHRSSNVAAIWQRVAEYALALPKDQPDRCVFAEAFTDWTAQLIIEVLREPEIITVNVAKVRLLDQYFTWYRSVPRSHRERVGKRGHRCIFQVLEDAYTRLRAVELSLTGPLLLAPPAPPPPPNQVPILTLGLVPEDARHV